MTTVADSLEELEGVSRVRRIEATRPGHALLGGIVRPDVVEPLLGRASTARSPRRSTITLSRVEVVGQTVAGTPETSLVWADVLSAAWHHARPIGRYLTLMFAAGVIACYGVTESSAILIVGAMAVEPGPAADHGDQRRSRRPQPAADRRGLPDAGPRAGGHLHRGGDRRLRPGPARPAPLGLHLERSRDRARGPRRPSTTRRSRSRSSPAWRACWRSRLAPARPSASRSR